MIRLRQITVMMVALLPCIWAQDKNLEKAAPSMAVAKPLTKTQSMAIQALALRQAQIQQDQNELLGEICKGAGLEIKNCRVDPAAKEGSPNGSVFWIPEQKSTNNGTPPVPSK